MTGICPHCGVSSHFTRRWSDTYYWNDEYLQFDRFCLTCDACEKPICGITVPYGDERDEDVVWPAFLKSYADVPEAIATVAIEAHKALGAQAPRASVAMARATVEATATDKSITGRNLETKIDNLVAAGLISEAMQEAAHEIRFAGNEAAHGDIANESISIADATDIVALMDVILARVYQEPARVVIARVRASREARRNRGEQGTTLD